MDENKVALIETVFEFCGQKLTENGVTEIYFSAELERDAEKGIRLVTLQKGRSASIYTDFQNAMIQDIISSSEQATLMVAFVCILPKLDDKSKRVLLNVLLNKEDT